METGASRSAPSARLRPRSMPSLLMKKTMPRALSMVGVALGVLGQSQSRMGAVDLLGLVKLLDQTCWPLLASTAKIVSLAPWTKSRSFGPCAVATPATSTGAVMVESTYLSTGTASWVDQSCFRPETFFVLMLVS